MSPDSFVITGQMLKSRPKKSVIETNQFRTYYKEGKEDYDKFLHEPALKENLKIPFFARSKRVKDYLLKKKQIQDVTVIDKLKQVKSFRQTWFKEEAMINSN